MPQNSSNVESKRVSPFVVDKELNERVSLWKGDMLALDVDAIVNATSEQFNDRSVLSRRVMQLAGPELGPAIQRLEGCRTGESKLTPGFDLNARYIIHTVGPRYNVKYKTAAENALHSCYRGCLQIAKESKMRSIAFCLINSDKRGYPKEEGAHVALRTVRRFLEHFKSDFDRVIFCLESDGDWEVYSQLAVLYFPRSEEELKLAHHALPEGCGNEWGETVIEERVIRVQALGYSDSEGDDDDAVASSWITNEEMGKKTALTVMSPAKDDGMVKDSSPEEEETEKKYLDYLEKARKTDLSEFDRYSVIYHSGRDAEGRPIVVLCPCRLPEPLPNMDKFLLYLLRVLDPLVNSKYVLVYFHSNMSDRSKPDFSWMKNVYEIFSWKYSQNLFRMYIVHPTFWLKLVNTFFKTFASADFFEKVLYLDSLAQLFDFIPKSQLNVLPEVYEYDRVENGVIWTQTNNAEKATEDL